MNIQDLDLNLLKIFDRLYREKKLTRVANAMALSQPAVSHSLAKLRRFFDDPLFVREKNEMIPTPRADRLYQDISTSLKLLQQTLDDKGRDNPQQSSRTFVLGLTNYCSVTVLPDLLLALEEQAPGIRIKTRHATLDQKTVSLEDGSVDLVFSCARLPNSAIKQQRLFDDHEVCITGAHTIIPEKALTPDNIVKYPLIRLQVSDHESTGIFQHIDGLKLPLKCPLVTDQEFMIPQVVARTGQIGIVAKKIAMKYRATFNLNIYPIHSLDTAFTARQYWHPRNDNDPVHAWFRSLVKEVCKNRIDGCSDETGSLN